MCNNFSGLLQHVDYIRDNAELEGRFLSLEDIACSISNFAADWRINTYTFAARTSQFLFIHLADFV